MVAFKNKRDLYTSNLSSCLSSWIYFRIHVFNEIVDAIGREKQSRCSRDGGIRQWKINLIKQRNPKWLDLYEGIFGKDVDPEINSGWQKCKIKNHFGQLWNVLRWKKSGIAIINYRIHVKNATFLLKYNIPHTAEYFLYNF